MQLNIFYLQKSEDLAFLSEKYTKLISKYAVLKEHNLFDKKIAKAQIQGTQNAQKSYEEAFLPKKRGFCVLLDERGTELNSLEFAKLLANKSEMSFFIGGAYGFRAQMLDQFDFNLALSRLTLAHHFVKILLLEQLYRAFCINHNHPYHK
ncbi:23S rRNA (pseudouridine(1915)-N(3))-methyltransferase RlmH [Campylobacter upsaliensis]|uniref:23S rRNA (pseudouridine(1915)-N(3))-methyltransferase RlmH n=1 Tax=Campylobacter upsaliensis TaxID=28080 RepID=UPI0022EA324D|nr:23S rRNA (pseudouridine(1915)-N(3))-methyltransferase RlmH [Campylobacter upsaliensis]